MAPYFTYIDVLERLRSDDALNSAPSGLRFARPMPSRLVLSVNHEAPTDQIRDWLHELFGPRYVSNQERIVLDSSTGAPSRFLPVDIERLDQDENGEATIRLRPTLVRGKAVAYHATYSLPLVSALDGCPPVLTFHSFKGGMGRTTLALALATALSTSKRRILLVDADFEAPGVSLLIRQLIPVPTVAFADLLALANTDLSAQADEAIELVAERLRDQEIDGVFV